MKGYVIANIDVADDSAYDAYRTRTPEVIAQYGGRFLVRGGAIEALEGDLGFKRLVILEFPSVEDARRFYNSPEYQEIIPLRTDHSKGSLAIVAGV